LVVVAVEIAIEMRELVRCEVWFGLAWMLGELIFLVHKILQSLQK
jgi:hypothetical protein